MHVPKYVRYLRTVCACALARLVFSWMIALWETSTLNMEATGFCETFVHTHNTQRHTHRAANVIVTILSTQSLLFLLAVMSLFTDIWYDTLDWASALSETCVRVEIHSCLHNGILTDEPNVEGCKIVHILTARPVWSCVCDCLPQRISNKSLPASDNDNISSWSNWNVAISRSISRCLQEEPETTPLILPVSHCSFSVRPFDQPPEELSCTLTPSGCISLYVTNSLPQWFCR
jgi:hypothetical protein